MNDVVAPVPNLAGAVAALRERTVKPSELVFASIERCRELNPRINAFTVVDEQAAMREAEAADARYLRGEPYSLFDGLPIGVKDNIDVAGMPTSNGIAKGPASSVDAPVIAALKASGAIMLGKLNMHEAALGTTTENPHFGATRNPVDEAFSPGGSSGGSGAAVAANMVPLALGTDTMGSVRLPAASCGVVGWKPTRGLISNTGVCELQADLDAVGPLVNCLSDLPLAMSMFGVKAQPSHMDATFDVAILDENATTAMDKSVASWWQQVLASIRPAHVQIPGYAPTPVRRAALIEIEVQLCRTIPAAWRAGASPQLDNMLRFGERVSPERHEAAVAAVRKVAVEAAEVLQQVDAIISPSSPVLPTRIGDIPPDTQADYLLLANLSGAAAVSVPGGRSADGLPIGLHIMTRAGNDAALPAIANWLMGQLGGNKR